VTWRWSLGSSDETTLTAMCVSANVLFTYSAESPEVIQVMSMVEVDDFVDSMVAMSVSDLEDVGLNVASK
jgi:3D (Asp-Asp-Asp) domain-containing protein